MVEGVGWLVAGNAFSQGLGLVSMILASRLLGKQGFGELGMIQQTAGVLGVVAGFGLEPTVTRHVAHVGRSRPALAWRLVVLSERVGWITSAGLVLLLGVGASFVATEVLQAGHLSVGLRLSAFWVAGQILLGIQLGGLSGLEQFGRLAVIKVFLGFGTLLLMAPFVAWWGVHGAVAALTLSSFGAYGLARHRVRRLLPEKSASPEKASPSFFREILLHFSVPTVLVALVTLLGSWGASTLLARQPGGYEALGVFHAAHHWYQVLNFLPSAICVAGVPVMTSLLAEGNPEACSRLLRRMIRLSVLLVAAGGVGLSLLADPIMRLYGKAFGGNTVVVRLIVLQACLVAAINPVGRFILASGRMWAGFALNTGWAFLLVATSGFLVRLGSRPEALASAYLVAHAVQGLCTFAYATCRGREFVR